MGRGSSSPGRTRGARAFPVHREGSRDPPSCSCVATNRPEPMAAVLGSGHGFMRAAATPPADRPERLDRSDRTTFPVQFRRALVGEGGVLGPATARAGAGDRPSGVARWQVRATASAVPVAHLEQRRLRVARMSQLPAAACSRAHATTAVRSRPYAGPWRASYSSTRAAPRSRSRAAPMLLPRAACVRPTQTWARPCHRSRSSAGPAFQRASKTSCAANGRPSCTSLRAKLTVSCGGSGSSGTGSTPAAP